MVNLAKQPNVPFLCSGGDRNRMLGKNGLTL